MRSFVARIVLVLSIYVLRTYAIANGQIASAKVFSSIVMLRNEHDPGSGSKEGSKAKSLVTRPKERFTAQNALPRKSVTNKLKSRITRRYNKSSSNNKTLNSPRSSSMRFVEERDGDDSESRSHAEDNDIDVTYLGDRTTLNESKAYAITRQVSAFISLVASISLLTMLLRSYKGLGTTFHRLLFGLCIADILSSFASVFATVMAPKETSYYIWNARGNSATCDAQGFILAFGSGAGILYNCSLCFYHLSVVKYERSDEYIRTKIEPYYHVVSILIPLVVSITTLAKQAFNPAPNDGICWGFQYNPPHCENLDLNTGDVPDDDMYNIECGRGPDAALLSLMFGLPMLLSSPIVIVVTMTMTYRAVLRNEKKLSKYGVGALRASVARSSMMASNANGISRRSSVFSTFQNFRRGSWDPNSSSMSGSHDQMQFQVQMQRNEMKRRKKRTARSRAVLKKGISYSSAYLLCYMPYLVSYAVYVAIDRKKPFFLVLFIQMFIPLQGFFNFIIFLSPKIRAVRVNNDISFFHAMLKAVKSRGQKMHRNSLHDYALHQRGSGFIENTKNSLRSSVRRWKKQDESRCTESEPNRLSQSIHRLSSNFALNLGNVDVKVKLGVEGAALSDNYKDSVSNKFIAPDSLEPNNPQSSEAEDDYAKNISQSLSENKDSTAHNAQDINNLHQTKDGSNPPKEMIESEVENLVEDDDDDILRNTNSTSSLHSNPMNRRQCGQNDFGTRCGEGKKVPTKDKELSARKVEEGTLSRIYNELALHSNTHVSLEIDIPEQ